MNLDLQGLRGVGAKEGVTEAVYGQQSAEVTREAMVRILPLQAQLAMAHDDVHLAQQRTDTLFKIYKEDADRRVDFYNNQVKMIYDDATAKEKRQYDENVKQKEWERDMEKEVLNNAHDTAVAMLKEGNYAGYNAVTGVTKPKSFSDVQRYEQEVAGAVTSNAVANVEDKYNMSTRQSVVFNQIATKYTADTIVKQGQQAQVVYNLADTINANPEAPGNQLIALYTLVKNLDPDSAVREGELDLATKTNSFLGKFGDSLTRISEGRVLNPTATKELMRAAVALADEWKLAGQRREQQYASQAAVNGVSAPWNDYIQAFGGVNPEKSADRKNANDPLLLDINQSSENENPLGLTV
jgi:hypothetical protein